MSSDSKFVMVLAVTVTLVALGLFTASRLFKQDDTLEKCVLYELNEHRLNDYDAHRDEAIAEGRQFMVPADAPEPLPREFSRACDQIMN